MVPNKKLTNSIWRESRTPIIYHSALGLIQQVGQSIYPLRRKDIFLMGELTHYSEGRMAHPSKWGEYAQAGSTTMNTKFVQLQIDDIYQVQCTIRWIDDTKREYHCKLFS
jgi:hypothetical protein